MFSSVKWKQWHLSYWVQGQRFAMHVMPSRKKWYAMMSLISLLIETTRVRGQNVDMILDDCVSCLISLRIYIDGIVTKILLSWKFIISNKLNASKLTKATLIFYHETKNNPINLRLITNNNFENLLIALNVFFFLNVGKSLAADFNDCWCYFILSLKLK